MKTIPISAIFDIEYGNRFNLNKLDQVSSGVAFISRSGQNNGYKCDVSPINGKTPYDSGLITVAMNGAVLSAFVQPRPFYTAQKIKVLKPKVNMSLGVRLAYCTIIYANHFRYTTHGREADITFDNLLVPHPNVVKELSQRIEFPEKPSDKPLNFNSVGLFSRNWKSFLFEDLFTIKKGKRLKSSDRMPGANNYIGAIDNNNGVSDSIENAPIFEENTITVSYNGSVGEAFYQNKPFWASDDINVLYLNRPLNPFIALFLCSVIRAEKYRFNYGRKWYLNKMKDSAIKLPVTDTGEPDWQFMEDYVKSLPYSSNL